jgi:hypothetical protein
LRDASEKAHEIDLEADALCRGAVHIIREPADGSSWDVSADRSVRDAEEAVVGLIS